MSKIIALEAVPFRLTPRRDFKWAGLQVDLGGFVLVRVRTEDGIIGYGEATPLPDWGGDFGRRGGETQATVVSMVRDVLAPGLIGHDVTAVTQARRIMDRVLTGNGYAKNAVDMALHDAWGKVVGLPVYKLLGGAVRDGVQVAHMVGLMNDRDAINEAVDAARDGLTALQIKGGVDAERDIRLIAVLRKELGAAINLRLDANQGYRNAQFAVRTVARLAEAGADSVEQPTEGWAAMAEVVRHAAIPVIADESCWDINDALEVVGQRAADAISIYLAKSGGMIGARKVAAVAEARHLACDVNGSIESAIGNAANVHFALATPAVTLASVIPVSAAAGQNPCRIGGNYYEDDVISDAFAFRDGHLLPLEKPGLGIEIGEAKLARFAEV